MMQEEVEIAEFFSSDMVMMRKKIDTEGRNEGKNRECFNSTSQAFNSKQKKTVKQMGCVVGERNYRGNEKVFRPIQACSQRHMRL